MYRFLCMPSVLITIPRATVLIAQSKYLPLLPRNIINQLYTYYCNIEPKWFLTSRDKVVFHFISFHPAPPFPSYSCNVQTIARRPCSHSILPPAVAFFCFCVCVLFLCVVCLSVDSLSPCANLSASNAALHAPPWRHTISSALATDRSSQPWGSSLENECWPSGHVWRRRIAQGSRDQSEATR